MAQFFVSCPLNFENNLVEEIKSFWFEMMDLDGLPTREPLPEFKIEAGGVEIKCPDHLGYQINFFTKLAHRILIRIHHFQARYYDQYEKEMSLLPLKKWLETSNGLHLKIETAKSRLNHERNLIESATRALGLQGYKVVGKDQAQQQLYVRIFRDHATISLDTSGEHLHRRGYAIFRGEAPLRENLAALLTQQLYFNTSGFRKIVVIDPFAGSGTTLFETASFRTPNFKRSYNWLQFLNKPKIFSSPSWIKNYRWINKSDSLQLIAVDSDKKAIENTIKNKELFAEIFPEVELNLETINSDSELLTPEQFDQDADYWILSNPPYGIRLLQDRVSDIFTHLEKIIRLQGAIILHPESMNIYFNQLNLSSEINFANQGLNIKLSLFKRPNTT